MRLKLGDRVAFMGPSINENWDMSQQATVVAVHENSGRVDVVWDGGGTNRHEFETAYYLVEAAT